MFYGLLPSESLIGAFELFCSCATVVTAAIGFFMTARF